MTAQIPDWQQQAQSHFSQGNYSEAASLYEQAIATNPDVRDYYWHLGLLYLLQGQEEEAQMTWLSAIADGTPEQIEVGLAELVNVLNTEALNQETSENYELAWLIRQHIRENAPEDVNNLYALGNICARLGQTEEAIAIHQEAIQIDPQFAPSYVSIARLLALANRDYQHTQRDRVEQSIQALETAIAIDPELPILHELAYLWNILGEYAKGEEYARAAIARDPEQGELNSFTSRVLAEALLGQGKFEQDPTCTIDFSPLKQILDRHISGESLGKSRSLDSVCVNLRGHSRLDSSKPIVFLSADRVYFRNFGVAQALSLYETSPGYSIHFHIMDPDLQSFQLLNLLQAKLPDQYISHSYEFSGITDSGNPKDLMKKLVYYCCARFCRAAELARNANTTVIITDADILFRRNLDSIVNTASDYDIALVDFGMGKPIYDRYCASFVVVRAREAALNYLESLSNFIVHNLKQRSAWMLDQFSLYGVAKAFIQSNPNFNLKLLSDKYASTSWDDDALIWTANGKEKWEQNSYTDLKQQTLEKFGFAFLSINDQVKGKESNSKSIDNNLESDEIGLQGFNQLCQAKYGLMLYNTHDLYIGRSLSHLGTWCEHEIELLKQLINENNTVLDVGANIGTHTLAFCRFVGGDGRVYAFEAQRIIYQSLVGNIALNSITNAYCLNQAVGAEPGFIDVPQMDYSISDNFGGVVLQGTSILAKTTASRYERVEMIMLDSLNLQQCHLIKADVEGMERDVVLGAKATIDKFHPILYLECHDDNTRKPLIQLCQQFGYTLYWHGTKNDPNILGIHPERNLQFPELSEVL